MNNFDFFTISYDKKRKNVNVFMKLGEGWLVIFNGLAVTLQDTPGMVFLQHYLSNPNKIHPVICFGENLSTFSSNGSDALTLGTQRRLNDTDGELQLQSQQVALETTDKTTVQQVKSRMLDIKKEMQGIENNLDDYPGASDHFLELREELEGLEDYISKNTGINDRPRKTHDNQKQLKDKTTGAIRRTLKKIAIYHPALGKHLKRYLKNKVEGHYCPPEKTYWDTGA